MVGPCHRIYYSSHFVSFSRFEDLYFDLISSSVMLQILFDEARHWRESVEFCRLPRMSKAQPQWGVVFLSGHALPRLSSLMTARVVRVWRRTVRTWRCRLHSELWCSIKCPLTSCPFNLPPQTLLCQSVLLVLHVPTQMHAILRVPVNQSCNISVSPVETFKVRLYSDFFLYGF